jgi:hypothetical protein
VRTFTLACVVLLGLAGCVTTTDWTAVKDQADAYRTYCEQWHGKEGRLAVEKCADPSMERRVASRSS